MNGNSNNTDILPWLCIYTEACPFITSVHTNTQCTQNGKPTLSDKKDREITTTPLKLTTSPTRYPAGIPGNYSTNSFHLHTPFRNTVLF